MGRKTSKYACLVIGLAFLALFTFSQPASALEVIVNGGFETGNFAGWGALAQPGSSGNLFVVGPGFTPLSGHPSVGPAAGNFYALSDQTGPGAYVLFQTFVVPANLPKVTLSFDMFDNDWNWGPIVHPSGFDYTSGGTGQPNQHSRVDILLPGGNPFSNVLVLANYYLGVDPQVLNPNPYTHYSFDITNLVAGGGAFDLRFGEVDNQNWHNLGVDNVSVNAVPIPPTVWLFGSSLVGLIGLRRFRRS